MPAWHAGRDILAEGIDRVDVERGAAGELNRVFGLKLMELFEERLPYIGDGHLPFNSDFHGNSPKNEMTCLNPIPLVYNLKYNNANFATPFLCNAALI